MDLMSTGYAGDMSSGPVTRAEWVDSRLRRAILHGDLAPGERLRAEHLAEQFGVSPTPLRETFMRLAGEGLVVIEPQRGARVAPLDLAEAIELYEVRLLVDPEALRRSIRAARAGDDAAQYAVQVSGAHDALCSPAPGVALHEVHRAFHLALVSWCPNQRLVRHVAQLLEQSQRFQAVGLATARRTDPASEHRELAEAAAAGDHRRAVSTLRDHLTATLDAVRAVSRSA